jgi:hypothetical protein
MRDWYETNEGEVDIELMCVILGVTSMAQFFAFQSAPALCVSAVGITRRQAGEGNSLLTGKLSYKPRIIRREDGSLHPGELFSGRCKVGARFGVHLN